MGGAKQQSVASFSGSGRSGTKMRLTQISLEHPLLGERLTAASMLSVLKGAVIALAPIAPPPSALAPAPPHP